MLSLLLQWCYISGPSLSVWNNSTTNVYVRWSYRLMVTLGCIIDLCCVTTLEWGKSILTLITNILAVLSYVIAKIASGFKSPKPVVGTAVTMNEIKLGPFVCYCFAHEFVTMFIFSVLYFIHGSQLNKYEHQSQVQRAVVVLLGLAPLIQYFFCIIECSQMKTEGEQL